MAHDRKTYQCHDNWPVAKLKKEDPAEYNRQERAVAENKTKPLSTLMDIVLKPLKEFPALEGTPFVNYTEPYFWHDYWEIFIMRNATLQNLPDEADDDDESMEALPNVPKKQGASKKRRITYSETESESDEWSAPAPIRRSNRATTAKVLLPHQVETDNDSENEF